MNQKLSSGLIAALLVSVLGATPSGYADPAESVDESGATSDNFGSSSAEANAGSAANSRRAGRVASNTPEPRDSSASSTRPAAPDEISGQKPSSPIEVQPSGSISDPSISASPTQAAPSLPQPASAQPTEAVKVGAYQSQAALRVDAVATIQPHVLRGRQAATLYVRNIPVLTFLGTNAADAPSTQVEGQPVGQAGAEVKIASVQSSSNQATVLQSPPETSVADSRDPVWRATTTAARLNQLYRDSVDPSEIKITWDNDRRKYVVKAKEVEIIALDADTVLPDNVSSDAGDLLQATNRIRRQMGNASPLSSIEGDPNGFNQVNLGPVSLRVSGYASWYGPGFDGGYSASGERFNQEALTAAHPSLPFGTQIRVTNMDNGDSVVVRVTDRGPYAHGRVIDLSTGAARVIGLIQAGVAPVSLEVLGAAQAASR